MKHEAVYLWRLPFGICVELIAQQGAADVFHVDPDLMGATGMEMAQDQGPSGGCRPVQDIIIRNGRTARSCPRIEDCLHLASYRMAANMSKDRPRGLNRRSLCNREIELGSFSVRELFEQGLQSLVTSRRNDAAAGILVEAVHDAGALDPADAGESALAVVQKGVHKSSVRISRCGMNHESGWLVNDNQVLVLMEDLEGNVLRNDF